jgi:polysaccharide export outer membrane protein
MPECNSRRLKGVVAVICAAFLGNPGCESQLTWVPAEARVAQKDTLAQTSGSEAAVVRASSYPATIPVQNYVAPASCPNCLPPLPRVDGSMPGQESGPNQPPLPTELQKVSHPPYMVEPPDILLIDAVRLVPKPPYRIEPLDQLLIQVTETFPNQPIAGLYTATPDGFINLGFNYGTVRVVGLTLEQAEAAIRAQLGRILRSPGVSVALAQFRGMQQIRGEHLVRQDGTISLGVYGCVPVTGLTLAQIKMAVERQLSLYLKDPEVAIDVYAYNSKAYYVIADGAGYGQFVYKLPITGNETVLDAVERIGGIPAVGSKRQIWVARPSPCGHPCDQILPVDWMAITQGGSTCTNYQLFPGDRVYIKSDPLIHFDYALAKVLSPVQRVLGITLLGATTYQAFRINSNNNGGFLFVR